MAETGGSTTAIPDPSKNIDAISDGNAAGNKEPPKARRNRMRLIADRKRQSQVKNHFAELQRLVPNITEKRDKETLVGQTIDYIQSLEKTKAMLEKRKQELALAQQVASSSSAPPQTAQGITAAMLSSEVPDVPAPPPQPPLAAAVPVSADAIPQPLQQPLAAAAVPAPTPLPQLPMAAAGQVGFQTWSWPNLVLNVSNDNAYINVSVPRHLGMQNMVMVLSVLKNYGIDVVTTQIDSDAVRSVFNIYAGVTRMGGENRSSEEVYKLAMLEILLLLNTN